MTKPEVNALRESVNMSDVRHPQFSAYQVLELMNELEKWVEIARGLNSRVEHDCEETDAYAKAMDEWEKP